MLNLKRIAISPAAPVLLAMAFGLWGLSWGLPSKERVNLFLKPEWQTAEFYQKVAAARSAYYDKIGENPIAYYGRMSKEHKSRLEMTDLLSVYGSFLARSHHGDEQMILVMLSHLNPLKGRWYPQLFMYGGAYVYPLAIYMGLLHLVHLIKLVPDTAFYYAHPEEMARLFLAVRTWSVWGMMLAALPVFYLGKRYGGAFVGFLASCLFVLSPASIAVVKIAKPHPWSAAGLLAAIYFGARSKDDSRWRPLILAALCFGFALGCSVSQGVFVPFLIWACWAASWKKTLQRLAVAGVVSFTGFLATNFYIVSHFQDFADELAHSSDYFPFVVRPFALWQFVTSGIRVSLGSLLWVFAIAGIGVAIFRKNDQPIRALTLLTLMITVYFAFQLQAMDSRPMFSRYFMALIGLWSLLGAYFVGQLPRRNILGGLLLGAQLAIAAVYNLNYASDRAPRDNASLAALWIHEHVPAGSQIAQDHVIPHTLDFPPIDFSRYRIVEFKSPEFKNPPGPAFAVIDTWVPDWASGAREMARENGYSLVKIFAESPLQKRGLADPFMPANFPLEIYARK